MILFVEKLSAWVLEPPPFRNAWIKELDVREAGTNFYDWRSSVSRARRKVEMTLDERGIDASFRIA